MKRFFLHGTLMAVLCYAFPAAAVSQARQDRQLGDNEFLMKAMESNRAEVELGRLALTKAQDQRVKDFAQMVIKDHQDALKRMHQVASGGANVTMPSADTPAESNGNESEHHPESMQQGHVQLSPNYQQLYDRLSSLSGDEFDREYIKAMVQQHRKDVGEFEREAGASASNFPEPGREKPAAENMDAPTIAREFLPTLKKHLQDAENLEKELH